MGAAESIFITEQDFEQLERLVSTAPRTPNVEKLEEELARATVVAESEVTRDIVTMNSRVKFEDLGTGEESELALVFPSDADVASNKVSVLAPVGSALLGLKVGDEIDWPMPSGKDRRLRVISILYQPESDGK